MALEVNGELIDDALIRAQASFLQERDPIAKWDEARERVIANTLLRQKARAEKLDPATLSRLIEQSQSGSNCISRLRHNAQLAESMAALQLDQLVGRVIGKVPKPSRKEIVSYFRSHLQQTEMPEMARVSHIVKNLDETRSEVVARAAIDEIAARILVLWPIASPTARERAAIWAGFRAARWCPNSIRSFSVYWWAR